MEPKPFHSSTTPIEFKRGNRNNATKTTVLQWDQEILRLSMAAVALGLASLVQASSDTSAPEPMQECQHRTLFAKPKP